MGVTIDRGVRSGNAIVDAYIDELERELLSFELVHLKKLILSCDEVAGILANDILITIGKVEGSAKILSEDKNDAMLDRVLKIVDKIDSFRKLNDAAKTLMPLIKEDDKVKQLDGAELIEEESKVPLIERLPRRKI